MTAKATFTKATFILMASALVAACGGGGVSPAVPANATATISGNTSPYLHTLYSYEATITGVTATALSWLWGDGSANGSGNPVAKVWNKAGTFTATLSGSVPNTAAAIATGGPATVAVSGSQSGTAKHMPLAQGYTHHCAVQADTTVKCRGINNAGQLGDGTTTNSLATLVTVTGLTGVKQVAVGPTHSCAVKSDGTVACWGSNTDGQLGDGSTTIRTTPVAVAGLASAVMVRLGQLHSCALKSDGTVHCWGNNVGGQLGDGTTTGRPTAGAVSGITNAVALASGTTHNCVVKSDGTAACWGFNTFGQIGNGLTTDTLTPVAVVGVSSVAAIATGSYHTCVLKMDATAQCWGLNSVGNLGDGSTTNRLTPVAVSGLTNGIAIASGAQHVCVIKKTGDVVCWGDNTTNALGDGTTTNRSTPVAVTAVTGLTNNAAAISTGAGQTNCILTTAGAEICWGTPASS